MAALRPGFGPQRARKYEWTIFILGIEWSKDPQLSVAKPFKIRFVIFDNIKIVFIT